MKNLIFTRSITRTIPLTLYTKCNECNDIITLLHYYLQLKKKYKCKQNTKEKQCLFFVEIYIHLHIRTISKN